MPVLLDAFCGGGGCAVGYHRAGFTVIGVDVAPQKNFPYEFVQGDALEFIRDHGHEFDVIHASPPCQRYSYSRTIHDSGHRHPDLVEPCRQLLQASGKLWVMENVPGAPMDGFNSLFGNGVTLCGIMFGLKVIRHRLFETSVPLMAPPHPRHPEGLHTGTVTVKKGGKSNGYSTGEFGLVCVAGHNFNAMAAREAMGIDWPMTRKELANAIPPSYCEFLGRQLIGLCRQ